jgi:hypothetical protein
MAKPSPLLAIGLIQDARAYVECARLLDQHYGPAAMYSSPKYFLLCQAIERGLLRCVGPLMAQSGVALRCQCLTAIGGGADIGRASRSCRSGAIDPSAT